MGILIIVEEKERGKYRGKKLIFTPEKIIEMPRKTATAKPMNGNSFSGKTNTSEDSNYLEDSNYIKNSKDRIDSFHTSSDKEKTNNNNLIIDDELKSLVVFYQEKINRFARPTKEARKNINARLKEYSVDDLRNAIEAFSKDSWRMQNNAQNTMEWFFEDDSQISKWLALEGKLKLKLIKI